MPDLLSQVESLSRVLNVEERQRAERFHFDEHRNRFIIARALLRKILDLYTNTPAEDIQFEKGERGKPYLKNNRFNLQFNLSHSHDLAVYAFTNEIEIGIDIEKIKTKFNEEVAKRFFSADEYTALSALPLAEQIRAFYQIWAGKEAVIKALGAGLYAPLDKFTLKLTQKIQRVNLIHQQHDMNYHLQNFFTHVDYQSAFATAQSVEEIQYCEWKKEGPMLFLDRFG